LAKLFFGNALVRRSGVRFTIGAVSLVLEVTIRIMTSPVGAMLLLEMTIAGLFLLELPSVKGNSTATISP